MKCCSKHHELDCNECGECDQIRELMMRIKRRHEDEIKQVSNWEIDDYYERKLKIYDTE